MNEKEIKIVIAGHVDHGKSTLVGRLLSDSGQIPHDRREKVEIKCRKSGKPFEFAFLLDAFEEEQNQGITIDAVEIRWEFRGRRFLLIDTPGHKEFSKNMATGASRAEAAIMLLDAKEGLKEQFRRHASILAMLGIKNVFVAVNKMDLISYAAARFYELQTEITDCLHKAGLEAIGVIPVCAFRGENLIKKSPAMHWYKGKTLGEALLALKTAVESAGPLRFSVQDVYKSGEKRIYAGRIEAGFLRRGDRIKFLPAGLVSRVITIEKWPATGLKSAVKNDSIGITLADPLFLERGAVGSAPDTLPQASDRLKADIFWMGVKPLSQFGRYKFRLAAQEADCRLDSVLREIDASTFAVTGTAPKIVRRDNMGEVSLRLGKPLVMEPFSKTEAMGRFVLAEDGRIVGGGIITGVGAQPDKSAAGGNICLENRFLTRRNREERNGHKGFVIWLTGFSGSGKSTIAALVEKKLFLEGAQVYALDGDNLRLGLNGDLGFSPGERAENIRRAAQTARLFSEAGLIVLAAFISPYKSDREKARRIIGAENFAEIFIDCPLEVCAERDIKGLYKKAIAGEIKNFTGVSAPYEKPVKPDLAILSGRQSPEQAVQAIIKLLKSRKIIK